MAYICVSRHEVGTKNYRSCKKLLSILSPALVSVHSSGIFSSREKIAVCSH